LDGDAANAGNRPNDLHKWLDEDHGILPLFIDRSSKCPFLLVRNDPAAKDCASDPARQADEFTPTTCVCEGHHLT
tara:strand:- start:571 stop:795 length:225 start_codon:yes stop_codon:yes gene_type:complete